MLFVGAANSDHFLFYYPLRFDIVFLIALFLMQLFQFFDSMWEVAPKINNFLIFGKNQYQQNLKLQ